MDAADLGQVPQAARTKLEKAEGFMEVASLVVDEQYDVAVSLAVSASVNFVDAICLVELGEYSKTPSHEDALVLVSKIRLRGTQLANHLRRVLRNKSKAQYYPQRCTAVEARDAYDQADRISKTVYSMLEARKGSGS